MSIKDSWRQTLIIKAAKMPKTLFFLFLGFLVILSQAQKSQICTTTSIEIYATKDDPNHRLFNYSATLTTKKASRSPSTQLIVTDETFTSSDSSLYKLNGEGLKEAIGSKRSARCHSIGGHCSWLVGNETAIAALPLTLNGSSGDAAVIFNVVDEGGINLQTGQFFSDSFLCDTISDESKYYRYLLNLKVSFSASTFPGYTFVSNQCCKDFKPVPPPVASAPKCLAFNATASFSANNAVFVTVNATFTIFGDGITISATSQGPNQGYYSITQNGETAFCTGQLGSSSTCMTMVPMSDFKVLFPLSIWQPSGQTWSYSVNLGRIISRDGTYEKEEGIRFTPTSPCSNQYNEFASKSVTAVSQFCCTSFAQN